MTDNTELTPAQLISESLTGMTQSVSVLSVLEERLRQDAKWGQQNHELPVWLAILTEELGEASQEWLRNHFGKRDNGKQLRDELVQCAAVALAMIECGYRNGWFETKSTPVEEVADGC